MTDLLALRSANGFAAIVADPPWAFANYSAKGEKKNPKRHYACMPTDDIRALPVAALSAKDAGLFLWATMPMLPDAMRVIDAWGFTYRSAAPWAKQSSTGKSWAFGPGYWFRAASEILLFATKGSPPRPKTREARSIRNLIVAPVREHSRKPDFAHRAAETWFGDGPYLELFARQSRPGWTAWGNETNKFDMEAA